MKKYCFIALALFSITLTSCAKKDWTCYCEDNNTNPPTKISYPLGDDKEEARDRCEEYDAVWKSNGGSCTL